MIKTLVRWTATLSLVGGALLTSFLGTGLKAIALPEDQVVKALQTVPVFAIADEKGIPLVAVGQDNKKVAGIFINQQDAQKFYQQLQQQQPDVASKVKIQTVSLAQVYKLQSTQKQPDGLVISYVPSSTEVEGAKQVLTANGEQYQGGVPLFVAKAGKDGGYLTINQNNQEIIPFFFEKSVLNEMVERFKKEKPDLAPTVKIDVVPLESVIATLQQSNDEALTRIMLVPSEEAIRFARENAPSSPQPAPATQTRPAPQQPTPKK
ncbi:Tic22 family protein [Chroococcus sp. FPU101]|uniref:Tic22 family protein n=1 Tax=Chroococcus sp. FPU101 TaxID=1974212 RepID=UPI001A90215D|nr:Tic22 family protein [Chroococcus sp. FPU101]GFE69671.1 Tic22 family protein [Chroococcus sp. FPU101]